MLSGSNEESPPLSDAHWASASPPVTGPRPAGSGLTGVVSGTVHFSSLSDRRSRSSAGALRGLDPPPLRALAARRGRARVLVARFVLAGLARFARGMCRRAARAVGRARLVALRGRARVRARFTVRLLDRRRPGAALRFLLGFDLDFAIGLSFPFDWLPISII